MREADDPPNPDRHIPALDGVRGVAILLVLAKHTLPPWLAGGGWLGVDVFFTLSGFLITSILLETRGLPGYWRSFFARRVLRIWPLYVLVIAALAAVATWAPSIAPDDARDFHRFAGWIWSQTLNLRSAATGAATSPYSVGVYWSVGVEEQFYLVWPCIVAAVAPRRLAAVCAGLAVGSVALRLGLTSVGVTPAALYVSPATHLDGLALGGALAALLYRPAGAMWLARQVRRVAAHPWRVAVPALTVLVAVPRLPRGTWTTDLASMPLASVLTAVVIAAVVTVPASRLAAALAVPWLVAVGRRAYGLYVLHIPVLFFLPRLAPSLTGWPLTLTALALSFALAWASWRWWEGPWLRLKRRVPRPVPMGAPSRAAVSHRVRVGEAAG